MAKVFSPNFKAAAIALLDSGVTTREAQAQLRKRFRNHVGEGTLRKWYKERDTLPVQVPQIADELDDIESPPVTAPQPDALLEDDADSLTQYRRQRANALRMAREAESVGNLTAAQRFSKQATELSLLIAREEKQTKSDTDVISVPRDEFERAVRARRDLVAALAADLERTGGIVCSHCGREIRLAIAKGEQSK
jgi:hypothetical protein